MREAGSMSQRVDNYVRGKLDESAATAFELELLESPPLQDAVEVALGLQQLAKADQQRENLDAPDHSAPTRTNSGTRAAWHQWSIAASLLVAAFTSALLWQAESENDTLQSEIAALGRPVGNVITIPVEIMRSIDTRSPDVIIRLPAEESMLVLDVELDPAMAMSSALNLSLSAESGEKVLSWQAQPDRDGRLEAAFRSTAFSGGKYWLDIEADNSVTTDRRLLEFRPAEVGGQSKGSD